VVQWFYEEILNRKGHKEHKENQFSLKNLGVLCVFAVQILFINPVE